MRSQWNRRRYRRSIFDPPPLAPAFVAGRNAAFGVRDILNYHPAYIRNPVDSEEWERGIMAGLEIEPHRWETDGGVAWE